MLILQYEPEHRLFREVIHKGTFRLGVAALESVGIMVDPTSITMKILPAIPLKQPSPRLGNRRVYTSSADVSQG
jgi:hypothetical protein